VVGRQEGHPAGKKLERWYAGGDLTGALHVATAKVAALSALVLSPLWAQQFGILCLTVCVIQLLGLISFDVT